MRNLLQVNLYLPHSGLQCYFGTGLTFCETDENLDGVGYLPDLWVEPAFFRHTALRFLEIHKVFPRKRALSGGKIPRPDGIGYLPDLWVEPTRAMELTQKLIEFYGLNQPQ